MKDLQDYDLDVMNLLKGFPKDEENSYLFIRATRKKGKSKSFLLSFGEEETINAGILNCIIENPPLKYIMYNAVLGSLNHNPEEIKAFEDHLKSIKEGEIL